MAETDYIIRLTDLELSMSLGIHPEEKSARQRILVKVEMTCRYAGVPEDRIKSVVDYDAVRLGIHRLVGERHFELQETFCEAVAAIVLEDPRVCEVTVESCKPDIYPDARIGCRIVRRSV